MKDIELTSRLYTLYKLSKNEKQNLYSEWRNNYFLLRNRHGDSATGNSPLANLRDPEIFSLLDTLIGHITDQDQAISITPIVNPSSPEYEYYSALATQGETLLNALWENYGWNSEIEMALWDCMQYGAGIFKTTWESNLAGGKGDATIRRVDPYSFYPDPNAINNKDATFFVEVKRYTLDEIKRKYPSAADSIIEKVMLEADVEQSDKPSQYNSSSSQLPKANATTLYTPNGSVAGSYGLPGQSKRGNDITSMGVNVYEVWLRDEKTIDDDGDGDDGDGNKDGDKDKKDNDSTIQDQWRVVVMAGDIVILDEWALDLYGINTHPYSRFAFAEMGEYYPTPLVTFISSLQRSLNRLLASMQQNTELSGNPIFLDYTNSGIERSSIVNRPGQRFTLNGGSSAPTPPSWLTPPSIPATTIQFVELIIARMENAIGLSGAAKGQAPAPRVPNASVQSSSETAYVRVRKGIRNLEGALRNALTLAMQLIIDNYVEARDVAFSSNDGGQNSISLQDDHFYLPSDTGDEPLKFVLSIDAGSDAPTSRSAKISEADTLGAMGFVDQTYVLEAHNISGRSQIIKRMAEAGQLASQQEAMGKRVRANRTK